MPARITRHKAQRALARATSVYRRLSAFIVTSIIVDALGYHVESESKVIPLPPFSLACESTAFARSSNDGFRSRGTFFIAASRPLAAATRQMIEHRDVLVKSEVPRGTFKRD